MNGVPRKRKTKVQVLNKIARSKVERNKIENIKNLFLTDFSKYPRDDLYRFLGDFKHFPETRKKNSVKK